jgi:putative hydrolase of the HAD superfamily
MASDGGIRHSVVERAHRLRHDEGVRTALLTNNVAEFRDFWRPLLPLDDLFDVVIDSSEVGMRKPDPRIFALVLEHLGGVAADRTVFLDDYEGNVVAARALGWQGIVVDSDPGPALLELDRVLAAARRR